MVEQFLRRNANRSAQGREREKQNKVDNDCVLV